ncbi:hypothetical protein PILCRDRAFT_821974 [Piloderma croceum F 1598]|uniref:Trafficking protein particle complex subunit 11 domain-containing protein n=1 Tax=Piloderma croceum (strain F 1598) TaxID=765440 RepID=A0A0C3B3F8_PILCF|nr:hypothetical protein PILCRDRAFT_821974 [Piloderma croceum F 1598]
MSKQNVLVTYAAPQSFQLSDNWKQVQSALRSQLPLRNIHWKSAARPSIRTIQELDIDLVPLDTTRGESTSQIPVTLLEKPLLNIYIVTCEDLETYRSTVKKQIKDWHSTVTQKKNQEWIILQIVRPDARVAGGGFFAMKGSILDRIKADFNLDKRDRCVQLTWTIGQDNPAAWAECINKIKDGLLSAFESSVLQREEDVKRSESQRQMPGWNFCTFFILKESLASSFEGVNLFQDALWQYDELETSFYQVLKEKNLSWFGSLITPHAKDDSAPLLSVDKKPYRDLILANTISVFDFRIYLLSRQCALLGKMGRIVDIGKKSGAFLGAFGRRLREAEPTLPEYFIESWTYSSALSVVEQCDSWANGLKLDSSTQATLHASKGELLELARNQLDIVGIKVGHLPSQPPFSLTVTHSRRNSTNGLAKRSSQKISKVDFLSSVEDREAFYDLYVAITNRAIDLYAKGGRRKFALKLHGTLAALDVHRGRLSVALQTYTSLPAHYAPHMWSSLESFMLSRALDTHAELQRPNDREWIHILLSFLKAYVEELGKEMLMHEDDKKEYVSRLVDELHAAAIELDTDLAHPDHPAIAIRVSSDAKIAEAEDGSFLDVTVQNHLPCELPIDQVTVVLAGRDKERLNFSASAERLAQGLTPLRLFCATSSHGTFLLDSSEVRMSHLQFQWTHRKAVSPGKTSRLSKDASVLVRIPKDLHALNIRLRQPHRIELDASPKLLVILSTGRNQVSKASLKLSAPSNIRFKYSEAVLIDDDEVNLVIADDCICLQGIAKDKSIVILLPHSDASAFHAMKVDIDVEYVTASGPSIIRTLGLTQVVATSLPVTVNVEDYFRGTRLFSKFTVSTTSHQHVRIASAELEYPKTGLHGVKIASCLPSKRGVITVTPSQPASFLFSIDSTEGPVRESLSLLIKYRLLREEVESLVGQAVQTVVTRSPSWIPYRDALVNILIEALETKASWVDLFGVTGELNVPHKDTQRELFEPFQQVKEVLHANRHSYLPQGTWREIRIPVDVPRMSIVAAAHIRILSSPFSTEKSTGHLPPLYAGQPISAILAITTSFHWGESENRSKRRYMLRFDLEEMVKEWLVSGRKRGDFSATVWVYFPS